jgi:hypothetical protein
MEAVIKWVPSKHIMKTQFCAPLWLEVHQEALGRRGGNILACELSGKKVEHNNEKWGQWDGGATGEGHKTAYDFPCPELNPLF